MTGRERGFLIGVIALGLAAVALSRASQWLGGQLVPDGDECIVALMAKHLAEGRDVSLFFWGQRYGLAIFETGAAALAFRLFGVSDGALKGAMLLLWSAGYVFYVLAAHRWAGRRGAALAAAALAVFPGWATLSMKAFGGPITAFALTGVVLWLIAGATAADAPAAPPPSTPAARVGRMLLIGACGALISLAHPLWLLPMFAYVARLRDRGRFRQDVVAIGYAFLVVLVVGVVVPSPHRSGYWRPEVLSGIAPGYALLHLPRNLWGATSGAFWMEDIMPMGAWIALAGILWIVAWIASAALALARPPARWLRTLTLAGALSIAVTLVIRSLPFQYRYLAPAAGPLVLAVATAAAAALAPGRPRRALVAGGLAVLLIASGGAMRQFDRVPTSGMAIAPGVPVRDALGALVDRLRAEGVRHVYCTHAMMQWSIMWASHEQIIARWFHPDDRVPEYPAAVERARAAGERIAVVGAAD
ncbi:MAG TPA: hypothetical protein VIF57_10035, partial [Polyangia bacterium]